MKKILVVIVAVVIVAGVALGALSTSTVSYESKTTEMIFENPQTGEVEWINLED